MFNVRTRGLFGENVFSLRYIFIPLQQDSSPKKNFDSQFFARIEAERFEKGSPGRSIYYLKFSMIVLVKDLCFNLFNINITHLWPMLPFCTS